MSTNRPSTSKPDPRIAQREAMVTRHKSAQMKRQLRTKNRSMKHLTDLLKSPTRETQPTKTVPVKKKQPSPKAKQSLLKSVEKVQNLPRKTFKLSKVLRKEVLLIPDEEYYPNKVKRTLKVKKVVLKPKHALRVVAEIVGSVKRKYAVPHKASDKPTVSLEASPVHLSMAEAMSLMEEQLTDEDMMEILTCPSPVWWEDPPDDDYTEDPIFTRLPSDVQPTAEKMELGTDGMESNTDKIILIPNLSAKSDKFLKKRSKLEDLLGSIKDRSKEVKAKNSDKNAFNEDLVVICSNYRVNSNEMNIDEISNNSDFEARLAESDDEIFHNSSMNEDELLNDLENMDIPIANRSHSSDVIVIDDDDDDEDIFLDRPTSSEKKNKEVKSNENDEIKISDTDIESVTEDINITCLTEVDMSKNLLDLQKCDLSNELQSPKSMDSLSSKSSQDVDTISDTNVKFLSEDEVNDNKNSRHPNDGNTAKTNEVLNKSDNNESKESDKETSDDNSVTVYKIIEEDRENATVNTEDIQGTIGARLNDHSKKIYKEEVNTDENSVDEKDLQCIFATKSNDYNKKISMEENVDDKTIQWQIASRLNDYNKKTIKEEKAQSVEAKLNDYFKKCKKVYQKRNKKEEKTDINKNDMIQNAEEIDNFPTMFCDPCKPSYKRVSENENVKYCLNCSSIFDTKDCTYCTKKFKNKIYICVPCKIKFCCDNFYKTHENHGCAYKTVCRKVVFTHLTDKNDNSNPNTQVINYSVCVDSVS